MLRQRSSTLGSGPGLDWIGRSGLTVGFYALCWALVQLLTVYAAMIFGCITTVSYALAYCELPSC